LAHRYLKHAARLLKGFDLSGTYAPDQPQDGSFIHFKDERRPPPQKVRIVSFTDSTARATPARLEKPRQFIRLELAPNLSRHRRDCAPGATLLQQLWYSCFFSTA